jgi:hypothetical protein
MNMPRAVVRISFICPVTFVASGELMSVHLRGSGRQREAEGMIGRGGCPCRHGTPAVETKHAGPSWVQERGSPEDAEV